jgi:hypothetical protein
VLVVALAWKKDENEAGLRPCVHGVTWSLRSHSPSARFAAAKCYASRACHSLRATCSVRLCSSSRDCGPSIRDMSGWLEVQTIHSKMGRPN